MLNERVCVRLDTRLANQPVLGLLVCILPRRPDETVRNVAGNSRRKQNRLLRHKANLTAQPLDVELTNVDAIERDTAARHVVEPLDELDDRRLATAARAYECSGLPGLECECETLEDWNVRTRGIGELDVVKGDTAEDGVGLLAARVSGINCRDPINRGEELGRGTTGVVDC